MSYTRDESPLSDEAQKVLHKAATRLREYPESYNQGTFFTAPLPHVAHSYAEEMELNTGFWEDSMLNPTCGTTACLAGHIALAAGISYKTFDGNYAQTACEVMELDYAAACRLFGGNADLWPEPYRTTWFAASRHGHEEGMARIAADLLDDLADGVVRWDAGIYHWTQYGS